MSLLMSTWWSLRTGFRQFIKDKPTKWGIKLWVLEDSSNGYTIDFNIHIGRAAGQEVGANGLGYDVVMRLMTPYYNKGYHLFVDNFYSTLILFRDLFDNSVLATGTILGSGRSFPAALKNSKEWAKGNYKGRTIRKVMGGGGKGKKTKKKSCKRKCQEKKFMQRRR